MGLHLLAVMRGQLGQVDYILEEDGVELPAAGDQQHGPGELGAASLLPMPAQICLLGSINLFIRHADKSLMYKEENIVKILYQ
jgi:hypothetical protein